MFKSPLTSLTIKFTLCGDLMGGGFTMWHRRLESTSVWPCSHFWDSWHDKSRSNKNTDIAGVQRKPGDLIRAQPDKDLSGCQRKLVVVVVTWSLDWSYHLSHQSLFLISNLTQSSHLDISSSSSQGADISTDWVSISRWRWYIPPANIPRQQYNHCK